MSKFMNLRRTVVRASVAVITEGASYPLTGIHGGASSIAPSLGQER